MKKTVTKKDGTVVVYEGTPQEIYDLEQLNKPQKSSVPSEPKLPPKLDQDALKKLEEALKRAGEQAQPTPWPMPGGFRFECPACQGGPWFGTVPPMHTCGKNNDVYRWSDNTSSTVKDPNEICQRREYWAEWCDCTDCRTPGKF